MKLYEEKEGLRRLISKEFPKFKAYELGLIKEYPEFKSRLEEVHNKTMLVLNNIMERNGNNSMKEYHKRFYDLLRKMPNISEENGLREYARNLNIFIYDDEI